MSRPNSKRSKGLRTMGWARLNSGIAFDPEVRELVKNDAGRRAYILFTFMLTWSVQDKSDGFVPRSMLPLLGGTQRDAVKLVELRWLEYAEGGWLIRSFADWQETTEDMDRKDQLGRRNRCAGWMKEGKPCSCGEHDTAPAAKVSKLYGP